MYVRHTYIHIHIHTCRQVKRPTIKTLACKVTYDTRHKHVPYARHCTLAYTCKSSRRSSSCTSCRPGASTWDHGHQKHSVQARRRRHRRKRTRARNPTWWAATSLRLVGPSATCTCIRICEHANTCVGQRPAAAASAVALALVSAAADDMRRNTSVRAGSGKVEVLKTAPNFWSVCMRNEGFANFSPAAIV